MAGQPIGTVTFLFTDIERSTYLLERLGDRYADVLAEYQRLLRTTYQEHGGQEVNTPGDGYFAVFHRARDALLAAVAAQRALMGRPWPEGARVGVRMALHTGEPLSRDTGYVGMDVHRAARMCAAAHGGQVLLSQTTWDLVAGDLPKGTSLRDLGEHRLKDLGLPQRMYQIVAADLAAEFPPLRSVDVLSNNLPLQLTTFIGRVHEIAEVTRLLSRTRLLTLTGAGGSGKTRLAIQVAADLLETFPDGVWWTELGPLADPELVPRAVATALTVPEQPGRALGETLSDFLGPKDLLLALDNCEHLVSACASLADTLLRACPTLRILATSREALGLAGELTYRVPSLSLPDIQRLPATQQLLDYEAIRLFVERATFSDPRFEITSNNAAAMAQICTRLDGIPLAIELAAARVKVLAVEQIARRLDDRFGLLTGRGRATIPRHQTLRAALDWSYALLSETERLALSRLSVFAGGWTLEAAEAVWAGDGPDASEILDLLTQLVDKSLVLMETHGGEARYRLLETVRQYGRDHLQDSGGEEGALRSHRDFFLALAEKAAPHLFGAESVTWLDTLEVEQDNLRAAFNWSLGTDDVERAAHLAVALTRLWYFRGYFKEGWESLTKVLGRGGECAPLARARVLTSAGALAFARGDHAQAVALGEDALVLFRQLGNTRDIALCTYRIGNACNLMGDFARAAEYLDEGMRLSRDLGDEVVLGEVLRTRGHVEARKGNYAAATPMLEEGLVRHRNVGYKRGAAISLRYLGMVKLYQNEFAQAEGLLKESVAQSRDIGDKEALAYALCGMGSALRRSGDLEGASTCYRESLTLARDVGMKWATVECLHGLGAIRAARGRPQEAAHLLGAAAKLCEAAQYSLPHAEQIDYDGVAAAIRRALGKSAYARAIAEGRAITLGQAIEAALAPREDIKVESVGRPAAGKRRALLTPREHEVAALIAQGLTNRQIAARLVITEKTADAHVQNILNKLGAHSRTQIALWAAQQGPSTISSS